MALLTSLRPWILGALLVTCVALVLGCHDLDAVSGGSVGGTDGFGSDGGGGTTAGGTGAIPGTDGGAASACAPGEQIACACGDVVEGFHSCLKDGSGYDVCWCPVASCASANDGVCDEPGSCDAGTDGLDCCYWANDGVCDEPTLCAMGTDGADCATSACDDSCPYANDGVCQYEGRAECDFATDLTDCAGSCDDSCGVVNGVCDEPTRGSSDGLCARATDCTDCLGDSCAMSLDGKCDDKSVCVVGTDCTDCGE